ncbi:class I tRNA ligase family protein, partial [Patescibacteria group bacterium]|nr:class I tRNA ligase family protein [Patescibacteria group bacterium]
MIKLYNTKTKKKEDFIPLKKGEVGIYSCGPTVYWNQHIGNMYAYVQWDTFIKLLRYLKYKVKWVMNITDVGHMTSDEDEGEDKIEKGAKRDGLDPWQVAEKYIKQFKESMNILNIKEPDVLCRATDHIKEQIELIKKIEKNGFAYKTKTGLVFDVSKFKDYAKFANLKLQEQEAGARVKIDPEKRQPWDFLLWVTNQPSHIMKWKSPWGEGFP